MVYIISCPTVLQSSKKNGRLWTRKNKGGQGTADAVMWVGVTLRAKTQKIGDGKTNDDNYSLDSNAKTLFNQKEEAKT